MIVELPDTSTNEINKKLDELRGKTGAVTLGRVLTLVIAPDSEELLEESIEAANAASHEHPSRVIVVTTANADAAEARLDAQLRVGGDSGASEVVVASSRRWALVHELRDEPELSLPELLAKLGPADLVIIEGFKRHAHPKLEIYRAAVGKPLLHPDDNCIVAVATDAPLPQAEVPVLMLDDFAGIANVFEAEALPLDQIGPPGGEA